MSRSAFITNNRGRRSAAAKKGRAVVWRDVLKRRRTVASFYPEDVMERVEMIREGVPASVLTLIAEDMAISRDQLYQTIGLSRATVNRKVREGRVLNADESERALGIVRLVGQVSRIVRESGDSGGFHAARWLAQWLESPNPALGGRHPAELMDTADGRALVSDLVARMQSGAYT